MASGSSLPSGAEQEAALDPKLQRRPGQASAGRRATYATAQSQEHFQGRLVHGATFGGPVAGLNPTIRYVEVGKKKRPSTPSGPAPEAAGTEDTTDGAYHVWRSRDNRKGRHAVAVTAAYAQKAGIPPTNTLGESLRGIGKMFVRYPVWDVSYDVATVFTWGSVVWVINGFFVWYPLQNPASEFPGEVAVGGGVTAFVGATIFEIGSVLLMLEAINERRSWCFGWALEEAVGTSTPILSLEHQCHHSHHDKQSWLKERAGLATATPADSGGGGGTDGGDDDDDDEESRQKWQWWPSWYELRTHYFRDIGFLACLSQMIGATIFWISGFTGLPPIFNSLSVPASNGIFWLPQVVGGTGFIVSSLLFMVETQKKWYLPAPMLLGWHVGFWNLVGAIGFTLCGALGFAINVDGVEYASTLATFVGSWAFLIGSVVQWYESLDKYTVSVVSNVGM